MAGLAVYSTLYYFGDAVSFVLCWLPRLKTDRCSCWVGNTELRVSCSTRKWHANYAGDRAGCYIGLPPPLLFMVSGSVAGQGRPAPGEGQ